MRTSKFSQVPSTAVLSPTAQPWRAAARIASADLPGSVVQRKPCALRFVAPAAGQGQIRFATASFGKKAPVIVSNGSVPPKCSFTLASASVQICGGGSNGSIGFDASDPSCSWWVAAPSVPWLSITSGAAGTGNGSVSYLVASNAGASRAAQILIAGYAFSINQAGATAPAPQTITFNPIGNVPVGTAPFNLTATASSSSR